MSILPSSYWSSGTGNLLGFLDVDTDVWLSEANQMGYVDVLTLKTISLFQVFLYRPNIALYGNLFVMVLNACPFQPMRVESSRKG